MSKKTVISTSMSLSRPEDRVYEQEVRLNNLFDSLSEGFRKMDKLSESKRQASLKDMTAKMQEAKTLIRDFERQARADNMSTQELNRRKKEMVQELNGFIGLKKAYSAQTSQRSELLNRRQSVSPTKGPTEDEMQSMKTADLMELGRHNIKETDSALMRSERLVNDTIAIGSQTAETLETQGKKLAQISADLDDIHFSMKKARQVIRDIARGLATDKCIMFFLLLIVVGILIIVGLKAAGVDIKV